jgi:hypothetical protein
MILPRKGSRVDDLGEIICAACGARERHPTPASDRWLACYCADPDRCPSCGECVKCFEEFGG